MHALHAGIGSMPLAASIAGLPQFLSTNSGRVSTLSSSTPTLPFAPLPIIPPTDSLSTLSTALSSAVMVNPNSPPVPIKLAQKAWNGEYIDMADLLPQALSAAMRNSDSSKESKKRVPRIVSIMSWIECFTTYISLIAMKRPDRVSDLLAYMSLIIYAARQYEENPWLSYDATFR